MRLWRFDLQEEIDARDWVGMLGWNGIKATGLEGIHHMTITEITLSASEFQTLIDTLDAGIKHEENEENDPDEQRQTGIMLTGILKKMAKPNASYTFRCTAFES